jgi:uncharacterized protein
MVANFLLDTGAILALLDKNDRWHKACHGTLLKLPLPALTSEAVITEVFHLIRRSRTDMQAAWSFLGSGGVMLGAIANQELDSLKNLMFRYKDRPMDFADATLVHLAERESISTILTVDQADFSTYRISGKSRFRVLPVDHP